MQASIPMNTLHDARAHLDKAREFVAAAEASLELGLFNAAASNAVIAGINAKDAICLKVIGATGKTDSHADAVGELARVGATGKALAPVLGRLLKLKARSQYQTMPIAAAQAGRAVAWARQLVEAAHRAVTA